MNIQTTKCVWLMCKLIIAAVGLLNICLLSLDLQADTNPNTFETVIRYGFLFILNSKLVCDVLLKSKRCEALIFLWAIFYLVFLLLNTIMIPTTNSVNFLMPVTSGTATDFAIYIIGLDQQSRVTTGFLITAALICTVITFHLFMIVSEVPAEINRRRLPVYYTRQQICGLERNRPPRYTSTEDIPAPPNYNAALLHAVPV